MSRRNNFHPHDSCRVVCINHAALGAFLVNVAALQMLASTPLVDAAGANSSTTESWGRLRQNGNLILTFWSDA